MPQVLVNLIPVLRHSTCLIIENRPKKYMFGAKNYGELPGTINKADGDPWDVIVPGYDKLERNKLLRIKKIEGIIFLSNGNHKLIYDIYHDQKRSKHWKNQIKTYATKYKKFMQKKHPGLELKIEYF